MTKGLFKYGLAPSEMARMTYRELQFYFDLAVDLSRKSGD